MSKGYLSKVVLALILVLLALASCQKEAEKPNIILIMTDDQGWFDVGFNGNKELHTPWLDSLAHMGIIFDRFYSASAVCSPTRASMITGRNPIRMNIPNANAGHMPKEEITIAEILKDHGYRTGHFGKWHLGTLTTEKIDANRGGREKFDIHYTVPKDHGYEVSFATESKVPTFDPMVFPARFEEGEGKRFGWKARVEGDSILPYGTAYWNEEGKEVVENLNGDNSKIIVDRLIPFIKASISNEQSFFTTVWFHTPHLPVVADSLHREIYKNLPLDKQIYYGSITALDEQVGRLWQKLEELDIDEKTVIMFCSDNGPERETPGSAGEFKARKRSLYEGGIRVPAFAIWKDRFATGKRVVFPAFTSDYLPTIMDLLDIEYDWSRPLDGVSILPILEGEITERERPMGFIFQSQITWVDKQYKLQCDEKLENCELYDLLRDKSESNNVVDLEAEIAEAMKKELLLWLESVNHSKEGGDYTGR